MIPRRPGRPRREDGTPEPKRRRRTGRRAGCAASRCPSRITGAGSAYGASSTWHGTENREIVPLKRTSCVIRTRYYRKDRRSNQSHIPFQSRKQMATPISDIPWSINAPEAGMDVPRAITLTIIPVIENNHRIIRSPPYQQVGLPTLFLNEQINCKFRAVADPLEYLRNRSSVPRWEPQN